VYHHPLGDISISSIYAVRIFGDDDKDEDDDDKAYIINRKLNGNNV